MKYFAILLAVLAAVLAQQLYSQDARIKQTVKAVCEYTRTTDAKETACGIAQDESNTEYLCTMNSPSTNNTCWVEFKR